MGKACPSCLSKTDLHDFLSLRDKAAGDTEWTTRRVKGDNMGEDSMKKAKEHVCCRPLARGEGDAPPTREIPQSKKKRFRGKIKKN